MARLDPRSPHPGLRHAPVRTLVLGASTNPARYAYMATERLLSEGHEPVLIGPREGKLFGLDIRTGTPALEGIHTVTLYLNPQRQAPYEDWILGLKPERVIFNPGTENPAFAARLREAGIEPLPACTLVMLSAGIY